MLKILAPVVPTDVHKFYDEANSCGNLFHCFNFKVLILIYQRMPFIRCSFFAFFASVIANIYINEYSQWRMQISYLPQIPDLDHWEKKARRFDTVYRQKSFDTKLDKAIRHFSLLSKCNVHCQQVISWVSENSKLIKIKNVGFGLEL